MVRFIVLQDWKCFFWGLVIICVILRLEEGCLFHFITIQLLSVICLLLLGFVRGYADGDVKLGPWKSSIYHDLQNCTIIRFTCYEF